MNPELNLGKHSINQYFFNAQGSCCCFLLFITIFNLEEESNHGSRMCLIIGTMAASASMLNYEFIFGYIYHHSDHHSIFSSSIQVMLKTKEDEEQEESVSRSKGNFH